MKSLLDIERSELKYYIPYTLIPSIRDYILPHMELDPYSAIMDEHEYTIRSIYFDSQFFDFYYEKVDGVKIRKKLRIRTYNNVSEDSYVFFEIKRRYNNRVVKERTKLSYNLIDQVCVHQKLPEDDSINSINDFGSSWYGLLLGLSPIESKSANAFWVEVNSKIPKVAKTVINFVFFIVVFID